MRVMLTRPRADSERLATALQAHGNEVLMEPLLNIVPAGDPPALDGVTGLIVTSANALMTFADVASRRDLAVYAVGDASAQAARGAGFAEVASAEGDVTALEALIRDRARPGGGTLLHIHGRHVTGDLGAALSAHGYDVRSTVVYEAVASQSLSDAGREHLADRTVEAVLFFSPRTMRTFVRLVTEAGLADKCDSIIAICLSATVAAAGSALTWRRVDIAATPDRAAMLRLCIAAAV